MRLNFLLFAGLAAAAAVPSVGGKKNYDGYKVLRVSTGNNATAVREQLAGLAVQQLNEGHDASHIDILVAPTQITALDTKNLDIMSVLHEDLGADIAEEAASMFTPAALANGTLPGEEWFDGYHMYDDHVKYWGALQAAANGRAERFSAGKSFEGRDLFGLHIWGKQKGKPVIYWHSNVHAREWITSMTTEYLAYQLVTAYGKDQATTALLDKFDFYIIPFVNPDGFVFTQKGERLWRKNRQVRQGIQPVGTDVNRNWPFKWDVPGGSSTDPKSETYRGQAAGDTPEMKALVAHARSLKNVKFYIDWHAYGQYILIPWGYDCNLPVPGGQKEVQLANGLKDQFAKTGAKFTAGQSCKTLYATSGSSTDFFNAELKVPYSWTIEGRPGPGSGGNGFVLPPAGIKAAVKEQWEGQKWILPQI